MQAFDLALCLGMVGRTADVLDAFAVQPFSEIDGDVGRTIVRQQSRPVNDGDVVEAGGRQGEIEGGRHVLGPHGRTEFPGEDRKSTRLNSSHLGISYAVFCLKKKKKKRK